MDASPHTLTVPRTARWWTSNPPDGVARRGTLYVLHGYGQLPAFFIRKFQAQVNAGWRVVAPEGAHRFYLKGTDGRVGASWMTREARLDDIADQTRFLDALRAELDAESDAGSGAGLHVLLGFSQGASTALRWAALGEGGAGSWDGLIAHSGVIPPDLKALDGDLSDGPALDVVVGTDDPYIQDPASRFRTAEEAWAEAGGDPDRIRLHTFLGVHDVDAATVNRVLDAIG